jgi:hypothetical protein
MPPETNASKAELRKLFELSAHRATAPPLLLLALSRRGRNRLAMLAPRAIFVGLDPTG